MCAISITDFYAAGVCLVLLVGGVWGAAQRVASSGPGWTRPSTAATHGGLGGPSPGPRPRPPFGVVAQRSPGPVGKGPVST